MDILGLTDYRIITVDDEQEKLFVEARLLNFPRLETVYHFKESFYDIYEAETKEIALFFHSPTLPDS